jgi:hypothetical protein
MSIVQSSIANDISSLSPRPIKRGVGDSRKGYVKRGQVQRARQIRKNAAHSSQYDQSFVGIGFFDLLSNFLTVTSRFGEAFADTP